MFVMFIPLVHWYFLSNVALGSTQDLLRIIGQVSVLNLINSSQPESLVMIHPAAAQVCQQQLNKNNKTSQKDSNLSWVFIVMMIIPYRRDTHKKGRASAVGLTNVQPHLPRHTFCQQEKNNLWQQSKWTEIEEKRRIRKVACVSHLLAQRS